MLHILPNESPIRRTNMAAKKKNHHRAREVLKSRYKSEPPKELTRQRLEEIRRKLQKKY